MPHTSNHIIVDHAQITTPKSALKSLRPPYHGQCHARRVTFGAERIVWIAARESGCAIRVHPISSTQACRESHASPSTQRVLRVACRAGSLILYCASAVDHLRNFGATTSSTATCAWSIL